MSLHVDTRNEPDTRHHYAARQRFPFGDGHLELWTETSKARDGKSGPVVLKQPQGGHATALTESEMNRLEQLAAWLLDELGGRRDSQHARRSTQPENRTISKRFSA